MWLILIILLILAIVGVPNLGVHSYGWGPSGIIVTILIILLVLKLLGAV